MFFLIYVLLFYVFDLWMHFLLSRYSMPDAMSVAMATISFGVRLRSAERTNDRKSPPVRTNTHAHTYKVNILNKYK